MKLQPVNKWINAVAITLGLLIGVVLGALGQMFQTNHVLLSTFVAVVTALACAHVLKWFFFAESMLKATTQMFTMGPFTGQIQIGSFGGPHQQKVIRVPPTGAQPHTHSHAHHARPQEPAKKPEEKKEPERKKPRKAEPGVDVEIE